MRIYEKDVIAAPATPPGKSAIAVIRMCGDEALDIIRKCLDKDRLELAPRRAVLTDIVQDGEKIDRVIVIYFKAPESYTGEDMIEISCHGGDIIRERIMSLLCEKGARPAEPGEFTLRAFLNGKMDLTQAEAVSDIIATDSEIGRRYALEKLQGGLSKRITPIRNIILDILAEAEADIEFPEEESDSIDFPQWLKKAREAWEMMNKILKSYICEDKVKEGFKIVIAGPPNSGKSTLLNRLIGEERAIVHHEAGTTRDVIRESIEMNGVRIWLTDTAGLRDAYSSVESEGISRAEQAIKAADMVLYLIDLNNYDRNDSIFERMKAKEIIKIGNKVDLNPGEGIECDLKISALRGNGIDDLLEIIKEKAGSLSVEGGMMMNERQYKCLTDADRSLTSGIKKLVNEKDMYLMCEDLKGAAFSLGEITGEEVTEEVLSRIFEKFCIGK
ncbi:tRNA uridine-5-carboxymethylaminomethyl(34) synthesis GTPase MnmE [bacterium]|nr:tRNA uridine-5-carboxymethylaminomethyl(34) synthesis GTPase MnmE [bacterium]